jgi:hypothetical protein
MVPWFDSIAYNAMMCSLPRFYGNESIQPDNEAHAFISCSFIQPVRLLLSDTFRIIYPSIPYPSFSLSSQLFGYNDIIFIALRRPWKLFHAECLNVIWYMQNELIFRDLMHYPDMSA